MKADEFFVDVMHLAGLPSREAAVNAVRSTLVTLSEHLAGGEPGNLAAQLPHDIAIYLNQPRIPHAESFDLHQFFQQVAEREGVSYQQAERDARAVIQVLSSSVTRGLIQNVQSQLPPGMKALFDVPIAQPNTQPDTSQTTANP
jgi:uncharacterized protein (DUF2267 family)